MNAALESYRLPDGSSVRHLNAYETDYLYWEIFGRENYLRHGIRLAPESVVFDVGANIGLFTLFVKRKCPTARVHAFEPIPEAYECLAQNAACFGGGVFANKAAITDGDRRTGFTYYPGYSVISGFHADLAKDSAMIKSGMRGSLPKGDATELARMEAVVDGRFRERRTIPCRTMTLSRVIAESGEARVDLLKIDAERSELAILHGIADRDWSRIRQAVLEIHDASEASLIRAKFQGRGFDTVLEKEAALAESGVYNLFAIRKGGIE